VHGQQIDSWILPAGKLTASAMIESWKAEKLMSGLSRAANCSSTSCRRTGCQGDMVAWHDYGRSTQKLAFGKALVHPASNCRKISSTCWRCEPVSIRQFTQRRNL